MKKVLLMLLMSFGVSAEPIPYSIDLPRNPVYTTNGTIYIDADILGYKADVWQIMDDGSGGIIFTDVMFYNRKYMFCLTPVLSGLNDDGTHKLNINSKVCSMVNAR